MRPEVRFPEIDLVADPLPNLYEVLAELLEAEPISRVRFAGNPIRLIDDDGSVNELRLSDVRASIHLLPGLGLLGGEDSTDAGALEPPRQNDSYW